MAAPNIGFLVGTTYDAWEDYINAFEDRLANGYNWNKNTDYTVEYQPASGQKNFYTAIATNFVKAGRTPPINIIVTGGTGPTQACIAATTTIPIVFATAADGGYLVNLSTGPVTGVSNEQVANAAGRLQFMQTNLSGRLGANIPVGLIGNTDAVTAPNVHDEMTVAQQNPPAGLSVYKSTLPLTTVADIPLVINDLVNTYNVKALYVCTDPLITANADILNEYAVIAGLKTMHAFKKNFGRAGNLFLGPKLEVLFSRAADFVYQILNSPNPVTKATIPAYVKADPNQFERGTRP